jgi:predicted kinase
MSSSTVVVVEEAPTPIFKKHSGKVQKQVAKQMKSQFTQVSSFARVDPFNKSNCVIGLVNRQDGIYGGSLVITHVNNEELEQRELIYGTPKLAYPYKNFEDFEIRNFEENISLSQYVVTNKYNGCNILFYKYHDAKGNTFVSAKTKGSPFVNNSKFAKFYDLIMEALGYSPIVTTETTEKEYERYPAINLFQNPPDNCPELQAFVKDDQLQSIIFELCGQREKHLVNYPFDLELKCLFTQSYSGEIRPYLNIPDSDKYGPVVFSQEQLEKDIKQFQKTDLEINEQYRRERNLPHKYEYNHFATEGRVLYLLDQNGSLVGRTMYKIKPTDIEEVHWGNFDKNMRLRLDEAIGKVIEREKPMTIQSIREELDMLGDKEWSRYGEDIVFYVECVKKPDGIEKTGKDNRKLILITGNPCAGKSAFAKALNARTGGSVFRVDSSVKNPEEEFVSSLHRRKHLIIDLNCQTATQRSELAKLANTEGLSYENILIVKVNTPLDVCKTTARNNETINWNLYEEPSLETDNYLTKEDQIKEHSYNPDSAVYEKQQDKLIDDLLTAMKIGKKRKQNKKN